MRGGEWLVRPAAPDEVFTPEELTPAQRELGATAREFLQREVRPRLEEIERPEWGVTLALCRQAGELGFFALGVPEADGGLGEGERTAALLAETLAPGGGFALTVGAHVGIGMQPLVHFGSAEQKARYLPRLASGEWLGAYALTESGSGSDALAARTTATRVGDRWELRGEKQWITNSGFADLFTVYAKVDGRDFSAFLVERTAPGLSVGPEEEKMGLHGSSTRRVILDGASTPAGNLLGEPGRGHVIAFGILNLGRFKLAAGCLGTAKHALALATRYAQQRVQFGRPIASFGLVREKLARTAVEIYALESLVYRTAGCLDAGAGLGEYAVECAAAKVAGSEIAGRAVDEALQVHGGYGYMRAFEVERMYRDARINRIFEGTSEINRLLVVDTLMRRALRGELPLLEAAGRAVDDAVAGEPPADPLEALRRVFHFLAALAVRRHGEGLREEQELVRNAADVAIELYACESALLRAGKTGSEWQRLLARAWVQDAWGRVAVRAEEAVAALTEGDERRTVLLALRRLLRRDPEDAVALRRRVAERVLSAEGYTG